MNYKTFTQPQVEENFNAQIFDLGNKIRKQDFLIEEIGDYIPGNVMVQDFSTMTNTYMNKSGCEILQKSGEELAELGPEYYENFFPAEEILFLKKELFKFIAEGDCSKVYSFFQRVRPNANSDYKWYFTTSRLYASNSCPDISKLVHIAVEVNSLSYVGKKIGHLFEEDQFIRANYWKYNLLSKREKEIIKLIVEGKSSYIISDFLYISIHTVNNHRKNILKKLEVTSFSQLIRFAVAFDII